MKKIFSLIVSLAFVFSTSPVFAATATLSAVPTTTTVSTNAAPVFTRSLGIGAVGQDVEALKKILSLEVGSTDTGATYTSVTAAAVSQLQNKYAAQILIPLGLSAPTGYVGPSTIAALNQIAVADNITLSQFAPVVAPVAGQIFTQTLSLGSTGSQVLLLKSVLSLDLGITLSNTDIFDLATQNAVNQFQQKYAAVILTPIGLTAPTGIVGSATRAKLNAILKSNLATASTTGSTAISTTQSVNTNTNSGGTGSGEVTSYTSSSFGVTTNTTPLCPIETFTYGSWGPCQQDGTQTRTASTTIDGEADCADYTTPTPVTTQSCVIEQCPKAVDFAGEVGTETLCLLPVNGITAYVALDFKAGVEYEDSSGNACTVTNGDDRLLFPLGDLTLQEQSTQIGAMKGGVGGSTYDAPDGLYAIGNTNTSDGTCQLWNGTVQMRMINPGQSSFNLVN